MRFAIFIVEILLCGTLASAQTLTIAAAADLNAPLAELAADYQKRAAVELKLAFGSSGNLLNQIQNGAPFDLFFSADEEYPQRLVTAGLAEPASLYRYAVGKLVLWVPAASSLNVESRGMSVLLDLSVKKIAIANPQHAPYGRAAEAALRHFGLYDKVADRLVLGEDVAQAAQFVESGSAQAGLIALTHVLASGVREKGRYWELPPGSYPPLNQVLVILSRSTRKKEAAAFVNFIKSPEAVGKLKQYGFTVSGDR